MTYTTSAHIPLAKAHCTAIPNSEDTEKDNAIIYLREENCNIRVTISDDYTESERAVPRKVMHLSTSSDSSLQARALIPTQDSSKGQS